MTRTVIGGLRAASLGASAAAIFAASVGPLPFLDKPNERSPSEFVTGSLGDSALSCGISGFD